jgi:hypothetical protein
MTMSARSERLMLVVAGAAALAFFVSFIAGLGFGRTEIIPVDLPADAPAVVEPMAVAGRVEVLNAGGQVGLARRVTDRLRDGGYDVVGYGNAQRGTPDVSLVIVRGGDDGIARTVARVLGIDSIRVEPQPGLGLDATVVLGSGFTEPAIPTARGR